MPLAAAPHLQKWLRDLAAEALGTQRRRHARRHAMPREAGLQVLRQRRQQARLLLLPLLVQEVVGEAGAAGGPPPGPLKLPRQAA